MSKGKVRKWKEKYSPFGFTATIIGIVKMPQCILCDVVFCNSNLKPSKLILFSSTFFELLIP